uniref:Uncharacterized protein n=1 Tax=Timema shepardi TaxID=629360 RepID=A0A7R9AV25_TIMSH|nr:unnamed protein product [Timema shepardi]
MRNKISRVQIIRPKRDRHRQEVSTLALCFFSTKTAPSFSRLSEVEWNNYHEIDHQGPGTYAFGYDVEDSATGNVHYRREERHANGTVTGSYGVLEANGMVRVVNYIADHLGYRITDEKNSQERNDLARKARILFSNCNYPCKLYTQYTLSKKNFLPPSRQSWHCESNSPLYLAVPPSSPPPYYVRMRTTNNTSLAL